MTDTSAALAVGTLYACGALSAAFLLREAILWLGRGQPDELRRRAAVRLEAAEARLLEAESRLAEANVRISEANMRLARAKTQLTSSDWHANTFAAMASAAGTTLAAMAASSSPPVSAKPKPTGPPTQLVVLTYSEPWKIEAGTVSEEHDARCVFDPGARAKRIARWTAITGFEEAEWWGRRVIDHRNLTRPDGQRLAFVSCVLRPAPGGAA